MGLEVSEYAQRAREEFGGSFDCLGKPAVVQASVSLNAGANNSAAVANRLVRIHVTAACRIKMGPSAVAASTDEYWAAGTTEVRFLAVGDRVSAFV